MSCSKTRSISRLMRSLPISRAYPGETPDMLMVNGRLRKRAGIGRQVLAKLKGQWHGDYQLDYERAADARCYRIKKGRNKETVEAMTA
jgi:hypothetical protein